MELHNIRDEYTKRVLSQHDCHENPISQFEQWQKEAIHAQVNEPTAMNIATVDEQGRPNSRMVLLKEVNEQGFVFFLPIILVEKAAVLSVILMSR